MQLRRNLCILCAFVQELSWLTWITVGSYLTVSITLLGGLFFAISNSMAEEGGQSVPVPISPTVGPLAPILTPIAVLLYIMVKEVVVPIIKTMKDGNAERMGEGRRLEDNRDGGVAVLAATVAAQHEEQLRVNRRLEHGIGIIFKRLEVRHISLEEPDDHED